MNAAHAVGRRAAELDPEVAVDPLDHLHRVRDQRGEVDVVEALRGEAPRFAHVDRALERRRQARLQSAAISRGSTASLDIARTSVVQARVRGRHLQRVAMGLHDAGVGIGRRAARPGPQVRAGLEHPALARAAPLQVLELRRWKA